MAMIYLANLDTASLDNSTSLLKSVCHLLAKISSISQTALSTMAVQSMSQASHHMPPSLQPKTSSVPTTPPSKPRSSHICQHGLLQSQTQAMAPSTSLPSRKYSAFNTISSSIKWSQTPKPSLPPAHTPYSRPLSQQSHSHVAVSTSNQLTQLNNLPSIPTSSKSTSICRCLWLWRNSRRDSGRRHPWQQGSIRQARRL